MTSLREVMPDTASAIDQLREVFGCDLIDMQIRKAMKGEATFYAEENGKTFGVKPLPKVQWSDCPESSIKPKDELKVRYGNRK